MTSHHKSGFRYICYVPESSAGRDWDFFRKTISTQTMMASAGLLSRHPQQQYSWDTTTATVLPYLTTRDTFGVRPAIRFIRFARNWQQRLHAVSTANRHAITSTFDGICLLLLSIDSIIIDTSLPADYDAVGANYCRIYSQQVNTMVEIARVCGVVLIIWGWYPSKNEKRIPQCLGAEVRYIHEPLFMNEHNGWLFHFGSWCAGCDCAWRNCSELCGKSILILCYLDWIEWNAGSNI